jgi:NADPH-dependent 2,4-dienoyl-CoA reductase/sulfur reductase-like enzyme
MTAGGMSVRTVVVVGTGLAGLCAARALREQGFVGQLTLVGEEPHRPYDRPPLSKEFLAGRCDEASLALEDPAEELAARFLLRRRAVGLDARDQAVLLDDGSALRAHGVVIATGASARRLPRAPAGVHPLRTLDDAWAIRTDLVLAQRVAVVGAGFIGLEVAATLRGLGMPVTVLEAGPAPLAAALGPAVGAAIAARHRDQGVDLRCGVGLAGFDTGPGGRVAAVRGTDGSVVPADLVIVGVGADPAVDWLAGSGLELAGGIHCDAAGGTGLPGVVAVGDCAAWHEPRLGRTHRVEHWTAALERPALAVATLLGTDPASLRPQRAPYFWSDQYDARLQFAGHAAPGDELTVEDGALDEDGFLAVYRRAGEPVAVVAVDRPRPFTRWRRALDSAPAAVPPDPRSHR